MNGEQMQILRDLAVIVVSATVAIRLFSVLKMPQLLGFILVGVILSPVTGIIKNTAGIAACGDLGVMFMMFFVGLEFNLERLKKVLLSSIMGLVFQVGGMVAFGMLAARIMGLDAVNGFFLGALLSMSSTIVIIELFTQRRELNSRFAQITVGILVAEDLFAVFLLVVLSSFGGDKSAGTPSLLESTTVMLTFVITTFVLGKLVIPSLLRKFCAAKNQQELIMFTFCVIMGIGFLANLANLSLSLGAFLAGSIISGTVVTSSIERITNPFKNLFVALFFVSVGTMIDPFQIVSNIEPILFLTFGVVILRSAATFFGIAASGARASDAFLSAMNKAQIGEFSFVVAALGINLGVINQSIMAIAMGVSLLTVFMNPFVSSRAPQIMNAISSRIPSSLKLGFEVYHKFAESFSIAAKGGYFAAVFAPLTRAGIYALLFNALMIVSAFLTNFLTGEYGKFGWSKWLGSGVFLLAAAVSFPIVWGMAHNVRACTLIMVSMSPFGKSIAARARGRLQKMLHGLATGAIILLLSAIYFAFVWHYLPNAELFVLFVCACAVFAFFIKRHFGNLGAELEADFTAVFKRHIENADDHRHSVMLDKIRRNYKWVIDIGEVEISDLALCAGRSVRELSIRRNSGADIAAIRRGRFVIYTILPDTRIYPDDIVVLSGTPEENAKAQTILTRQDKDIDASEEFRRQTEIHIECFIVPSDSPLVGKSLSDADLTNTLGVRILGILREGTKVHIRPSASTKFESRDAILALGLPPNLSAFVEKMKLTASK